MYTDVLDVTYFIVTLCHLCVTFLSILVTAAWASYTVTLFINTSHAHNGAGWSQEHGKDAVSYNYNHLFFFQNLFFLLFLNKQIYDFWQKLLFWGGLPYPIRKTSLFYLFLFQNLFFFCFWRDTHRFEW